MPLLYTTSLVAVEAIKELAKEFKNPRGQKWRVAEIETITELQTRVRAWDVSAATEHKCQVVYKINDSGETVIVESNVCQAGHYVSKLHKSLMTTLNTTYGRAPEQIQPEPVQITPGPPLESPPPAQPPPSGLTAQPDVQAPQDMHTQQAQPVQPDFAMQPEETAQPMTPAPPEVAMQPEMPVQSEAPGQPVYFEQQDMPVQSGTMPQPDAYANQAQSYPQDQDLLRRVETLEQNMGKWDSLINSYLGETMDQLMSQVDTIEERTVYLQRYAVSIELNLNLLWVLRFLIDKTRIRNAEIQQSADAAVAELRDMAARLQQGLWNGTDHETARQTWADSCRTTLEKHGFSDYYGSGQKKAS